MLTKLVKIILFLYFFKIFIQNSIICSCSFECYKQHKEAETCAQMQANQQIAAETVQNGECHTIDRPRIHAPFSTMDTVDPMKLMDLGNAKKSSYSIYCSPT